MPHDTGRRWSWQCHRKSLLTYSAISSEWWVWWEWHVSPFPFPASYAYYFTLMTIIITRRGTLHLDYYYFVYRPGSVYTVSVTSIGKGHRSKSAPVQLVMMPRQLPSPPPPSAHLNSPPTSTRRPPPPPPPPPHPSHPGASNGRTIINYTDYYSNNLFPKGQHGIAATSGTAAAAAAAAGVVYVRPEEIGIVILVLLGKK